MKRRGPVALQPPHLVEGSRSAGRGRSRRSLDVVEIPNNVDDGGERVIRFVVGGSERLCVVVVEISRCGRPGVSLVSLRRGLRFGWVGRSLLRLVMAVWRFREFRGAALVVSRESILFSAGSLAWRRVWPMRAGLCIRRVGVRDSVHWQVSASRGRRSITLAVIPVWLVGVSGTVEWHCRGHLRAGWSRMYRDARWSSGSVCLGGLSHAMVRV